jgi:hypothetical protein
VATVTVITNDGRKIAANRMLGLGTEPKYGHWGLNTAATTAAVTDTALANPATEARVAGVTDRTTASGSSVTNDSYRVTVALVADGAKAIKEFGLFDTAGTGSPPTSATGTMHLRSTFDVINLGGAGEGIQFVALHRFN